MPNGNALWMNKCNIRFAPCYLPLATCHLLCATCHLPCHSATCHVLCRQTALLSATLRTYQKAACDTDQVVIACPRGTSISIEFAQYNKFVAKGKCPLFPLLSFYLPHSLSEFCVSLASHLFLTRLPFRALRSPFSPVFPFSPRWLQHRGTVPRHGHCAARYPWQGKALATRLHLWFQLSESAGQSLRERRLRHRHGGTK